MTILASHTLEIQNYLCFRFIIILLITKNITEIITKFAQASQRYHFGASGNPQSSPCGGSCRFPALPPREAQRPPKWPIFSQCLKNPKRKKKSSSFFFRFFRFFFVSIFCCFFRRFFDSQTYFHFFRLRNRGRHWHNRGRHCEIAFRLCGSCDGGSISAHHGCPVTVAEVSNIGSLSGRW